MKNIKLFEEFNVAKSLEDIDLEGFETDLDKAINDTEIEEGIACLVENMTEEEAKAYFEDLSKRKPALMNKIIKWFNKIGKNLKKEIKKSISDIKRNRIRERQKKRMKYAPAVERRMKLAKVGQTIGSIAFTVLWATIMKKFVLPNFKDR